MFFWDREAFPKTCSFRNEKLVDVLGFRLGTSWVSEEAVGAAYTSSFRMVVLTTPPLSGWWCSTGTMGMDIPYLFFFFIKWCCVFLSLSVGCFFPPSFVAVVLDSHRVVLPLPSSFWVVGGFLPYTHFFWKIYIYIYIRSMLVRQKTLNKAYEVRKPEKRRVRHHHPRVACGATPTKEGGMQYPPEGEENGGTIIFTLSHCTQHVTLTEFHIMLLKWRVKNLFHFWVDWIEMD